MSGGLIWCYVFPVASEETESAAAAERRPPMRCLRQTSQHQTDTETSQGTAASATAQQRRVHALPQSVQDAKLLKQSPEYLSPKAEIVHAIGADITRY